MNPYWRTLVERGRRLARQETRQHVAAVERRHGDQVEQRQKNVDVGRAPEDVRPVQVQEVDIFERQRVKEDGDDDGLEKVARRPGRRDEHEVATRVSQPSDIDGNRLRPADDRKVAERSHERQDHRANQIDVDEGIERDPAEILRRRIAEAIGGPRVSRFVNGQREQHDNERDDGGDEVGRLVHKARKFSRSVKRKAKLPAYQGLCRGFCR